MEEGKRMRRLIPDSLGKDALLAQDFPFVGNIKLEDGIITFAPSILLFFLSVRGLPQDLQWIGVVISLLLLAASISLLVIKPNYKSLGEWVSMVRSFRERRLERRKQIRTDGGRQITTLSATDDEDTRMTTGIKKIHPKFDTVERVDGVMFGIIEFSGANLDTVDPDDYERYVNQLASAFNTQLREDVQFYLPKRRVDVSSHIEQYESRLSDTEVESDRLLSYYVRDRMTWLQTVSEGSFTRDYFGIVCVSPREVIEQQTAGGNVSTIRSLPLGDEIADILVGIRGGASRDISENEIKKQQLKELDRKIKNVQQALTVGPNNSSRRLDATQSGLLLKEYWEGKSVDGLETGTFVREKPYITAEEN